MHVCIDGRPVSLKRQADGRFADADLARVLQDATSVSAGSFKARGTPPIMRLNEIMGIEQSRRWGVCSLNDFRKVSSVSVSTHLYLTLLSLVLSIWD